jgi:hypothetical protein
MGQVGSRPLTGGQECRGTTWRPEGAGASRQAPGHVERWGLAVFAVLSVAVVGYSISVAVRGKSYSGLLDGVLVDAIEVVAACLCMLSAYGRKHMRPTALALGAGMLSWACGDIVLTIGSLGGAPASVPVLADAFYLGFYPMAYLAAVLFMRRQLRGTQGPSWLDGLIASLGAAAVCGAFAFSGIRHGSGTGTWATVINLAYPIGDLVLLGLAAGGLAIVRGTEKRVWVLLAAGMALVGAGDTANLFSNSIGASGAGYFVNAVAWPTAEILMAAGLWVQRDCWALRRLPRPPGLPGEQRRYRPGSRNAGCRRDARPPLGRHCAGAQPAEPAPGCHG